MAMAIGLIVAEWANLEEQLAYMFSIATADIIQDGKTTSLKFHPVAVAAMRTLDSLNNRIKVITSSFELAMSEHLQQEFLTHIAPGIRSCGTARNTVAHSVWAVSEKYPNDAITVENGSVYVRYTEKDSGEILDRVLKQTGIVGGFAVKCQDYRLSQEPKKSPV